VHLYVRDVQEAVDFYTRVIGFDDMGTSPKFQAAFVSAGGYTPPCGAQQLDRRREPAAPEGSLGLRHYSIRLPDEESYGQVVDRIADAGLETSEEEGGLLLRDPSRNGILLTHA
jgi:catechol 2,3-dioxygenase